MATRIDMEKIDYSDHADILKELYSGGRQVTEANWGDFLKIPLTKGYEANKNREIDFNQMKDICGNDITVTIVDNNGNKPTDNK